MSITFWSTADKFEGEGHPHLLTLEHTALQLLEYMELNPSLSGVMDAARFNDALHAAALHVGRITDERQFDRWSRLLKFLGNLSATAERTNADIAWVQR